MTNEAKTKYETPVTAVQSQHYSIRSFKDQPISDEMLYAILNAARRSPTSSNMQTYSIIVVRDPETRAKLAELAGNQQHIVECSVFVGYLADLNRLGIATEMHGETLAKSLETTLVSTVDAALVGMSAQTAAESFGLGAVMIGGMRNHPMDVAELLGFPPGVYMVFGMSIGWPQESAKQESLKPRLPEKLIIHHEKYDTADPRSLISEYDALLGEYYDSRNQDTAAWSGPIASRLKDPRRPGLRNALQTLGFSLD